MKNYAIMGASGQIGHVVAKTLLESGHQVRAIGRNRQKLASLQSSGAEIVTLERFDDAASLTKAFKGCDGIFVMIPPGHLTDDYTLFQDRVGKAIVEAIKKSEVSHVVNLSSIGAHQAEGLGPISGLHDQEERLNALNANILHIRPGYFMENIYGYLEAVEQEGALKTPLKADLVIPLVSTQDIGLKVAEFLESLNFQGKSVFDFVGPDLDLTMTAMAKILGQAFGYPDLPYFQQSYDEAKDQMLKMGMKPKVVASMLEMEQGFNEGKCVFTQKITAEHRGQLSFTQFVRTVKKKENVL